MSTQTNQFFKGLLAILAAIVIGTTVASYLQENYASFEIETEAPAPAPPSAGGGGGF